MRQRSSGRGPSGTNSRLMVLIPVAGIRHDYIIDPTEGRVVVVNDLSIIASDDNSITVQFTEVDNGAGGPADYQVVVRAKGQRTFVIEATGLGTTVGATRSIKADLLNPGTTYEIAVRAVRFDTVEAFFSDVLEQATSGSVVPQPTNLVTTSVAPGAVSLSCTDNGGTGFSWERRDATTEGAPDFAEIGTTGDNVNTFTDTFAFVVGIEYEWRVFATDAGPTKSAPSNTISAAPVIVEPTLPGVPTLTFVSKTDTTVDTSLVETDDGVGSPSDYAVRVWKSADANPNWGGQSASEFTINGVTISATLQFTVSGLDPSTEYQFQCLAFRGTLNLDAVFSGLSNVITQTTNADSQTVLAPTALTATVISTQLVDFPFTDNATNETGFSLEERDATLNGAFAEIETSGVNAGTGAVTINPDRGAAYPADDVFEARVKATGSPDSAFSNVISYRPNVGSDAFRANEPNGMTTFTDRGWAAACESTGEGSVPWHNCNALLADERCGDVLPCWEVVSDPTAPHSPPDVGQWNFREGCCAGFGPAAATSRTFLSGEKPLVTLYIQIYFKASTNWFGHPLGRCKFVNIHPVNEGANCIMDLNGKGTGRMQTALVTQASRADGATDGVRKNNLADTEIIRGQWHQWELIAKLNDPNVLNGKLDWWLDGVKQGSYSNLGWIKDKTRSWGKVAHNMILGGRGNPVPADQTIRIDHMYISGKGT